MRVGLVNISRRWFSSSSAASSTVSLQLLHDTIAPGALASARCSFTNSEHIASASSADLPSAYVSLNVAPPNINYSTISLNYNRNNFKWAHVYLQTALQTIFAPFLRNITPALTIDCVYGVRLIENVPLTKVLCSLVMATSAALNASPIPGVPSVSAAYLNHNGSHIAYIDSPEAIHYLDWSSLSATIDISDVASILDEAKKQSELNRTLLTERPVLSDFQMKSNQAAPHLVSSVDRLVAGSMDEALQGHSPMATLDPYLDALRDGASDWERKAAVSQCLKAGVLKRAEKGQRSGEANRGDSANSLRQRSNGSDWERRGRSGAVAIPFGSTALCDVLMGSSADCGGVEHEVQYSDLRWMNGLMTTSAYRPLLHQSLSRVRSINRFTWPMINPMSLDGCSSAPVLLPALMSIMEQSQLRPSTDIAFSQEGYALLSGTWMRDPTSLEESFSDAQATITGRKEGISDLVVRSHIDAGGFNPEQFLSLVQGAVADISESSWDFTAPALHDLYQKVDAKTEEEFQLQVGDEFVTEVRAVFDYGVFVDIPGESKSALLHISQWVPGTKISAERLRDEIAPGAQIKVTFKGRDDKNRIKLSR